MDHHTTIHEAGEGGAQAVCSCGWRSPVSGTGKTAGTMDSLQRAAEAGDLHEWEMSPAITGTTGPAPGRTECADLGGQRLDRTPADAHA